MDLFPALSQQELLKRLKPTSDFNLFPSISNRTFWDEFKKTELAKKYTAFFYENIYENDVDIFPVLPSYIFKEYTVNGNRNNYESLYFRRRNSLANLTILECIENEGKHLENVIEGIWQMLSEIQWIIPAHCHSSANDPLPDAKFSSVDLFSAETAMVLAMTYYLLQDKLQKFSPNLCQMLKNNISDRVLTVFEQQYKIIRWADGHNNWAPWCCHNILIATVLTEKNPERLANIVSNLMIINERFFKKYSDDGACDEGVRYWGVSVGMIFMSCEVINSIVKQPFPFFENEKLSRMGQNIYHNHINENYYVNFGDSSAITHPSIALTQLIAQKTKQKAISSFSSFLANNRKLNAKQLGSTGGSIMEIMREIMLHQYYDDSSVITHDTVTWYPLVQATILRQFSESNKGLTFFVKGGTNGENHNHNDVGSFGVVKNGIPLIIDIGAETYCRDTFSDKRYTLWTIRGSGHDVPLINKVEQAHGLQFKANNVSFTQENNVTTFSLDISKTYPAEAKINHLNRVFNWHQHYVTLEDSFEFIDQPGELELPFYIHGTVSLIGANQMKISNKETHLMVSFNDQIFNATIEEIVLEDNFLKKSWGDKIYKVNFSLKNKLQSGNYQFKFE